MKKMTSFIEGIRVQINEYFNANVLPNNTPNLNAVEANSSKDQSQQHADKKNGNEQLQADDKKSFDKISEQVETSEEAEHLIPPDINEAILDEVIIYDEMDYDATAAGFTLVLSEGSGDPFFVDWKNKGLITHVPLNWPKHEPIDIPIRDEFFVPVLPCKVLNNSYQVLEEGLRDEIDSQIISGNVLNNDMLPANEFFAIVGVCFDGQNFLPDADGVIIINTAIGTLTLYTEDFGPNLRGNFTYELLLPADHSEGPVFENFEYKILQEEKIKTAELNIEIIDDVPTAIDDQDCIDEGLTNIIQASGDYDIEFISRDSNFQNTYGYYVKDVSGNPTTGQILFANISTLTLGDIATISGVNIADIGFFLIPDGAFLNPGINDGDNITFQNLGSVAVPVWTAFLGVTPLQGLNTSAVFDNPSLNTDSISHLEPTGGQTFFGWEDLVQNSDQDFSDAVFRLSNSGTDANNQITGNLFTNDILSADVPNLVTMIQGGTVGTVFTTPLGGNLIVQSNGDYIYTASDSIDHSGGPIFETFQYTVTDDDGDPSSANLTIEIKDSIPQAVDDIASVKEGETSNINITFIASNAAIQNSYGYFIKDENKNPVNGEILFSNLATTTPNSIASIQNVCLQDIGFFLIPDGAVLNPGLMDGDQVQFANLGTMMNPNWAAFLNGVQLQGLGTSTLFDVPALNADGADYEINFGSNTSSWEDLFMGDFGYGNAIFQISTSPSGIENQIVGSVLVNDFFSNDLVNSVSAIQGGTIGVEFTTGLGGTLTMNADGGYTYIAPPSAFDHSLGPIFETFEYTVTDADGSTSQATLTIEIKDSVPVANDNLSIISEGDDGENPNQVSGNLLLNDFPSNDGATFVVNAIQGGTVDSVFATPLGGTLIVFENGDYTYEAPPSVDHSGGQVFENFQYTVVDLDGSTSNAVLTIEVLDTSPIAVDDSDTVEENSPQQVANFITGNLIVNDTLSNDDPSHNIIAIQGGLVSTPFVTPLGGTLTIINDGAYTYVAPDNIDHSSGPVFETFDYTLEDNDGSTSVATFTIEITDRGPIAVDDTNSVTENDIGQTANQVSDNVINNDLPNDSPPITVVTVQGGTVGMPLITQLGGTLTLLSTGAYTYIAPEAVDHSGGQVFDTIQYTIEDSLGVQSIATLTIEILDTAPTAIMDTDDVVAGDADMNGINNQITGNLITNDTPSVDVPLTVTIVEQGGGSNQLGVPFTTALGGILFIDTNGSYIYTAPDAVDDVTIETFNYTITDADGNTSQTTFEITVKPIDAIDDPESPTTFIFDESSLRIGNDPAVGINQILSNVLTNDTLGINGVTITALNSMGSGPIFTETLLAPQVLVNLYSDIVGGFVDGDLEMTILNSTLAGGTTNYTFTYTITDNLIPANFDTGTVTISVIDDEIIAYDNLGVTGSSGNTIVGNVFSDPMDDPFSSDPVGALDLQTADNMQKVTQIEFDAGNIATAGLYAPVSGAVINGTIVTIPIGSSLEIVTIDSAVLTIFDNGDYTYASSGITVKPSFEEFTITVSDGDSTDTSNLAFQTIDTPLSVDHQIGTTGDDNFTTTAGNNYQFWVLGAGNDTFTGTSTLPHNIYGGAGNDIITGELGNDILNGGTGSDNLTGGGGSDTFVFELGAAGSQAGDADTITDLNLGDTLQFNEVINIGGMAGGDITDVVASVSNINQADVFITLTNGATLQLNGITHLTVLPTAFNLQNHLDNLSIDTIYNDA